MGDILTIKDKILAFLKEKDIKKVDFFEATGIQSSNFKGKNMASQPGGDMIVKVLTLYPDLSAEWLMRGEGNMLKSNNTDVSQNSYTIHQEISQDNKQEIEKYNAPPEIVDKLLSTIKEQAEEILERLGIPVSVFIDMAYRQVIMRGGVPFSLDIPDTLATRDSLTKAEFDTMMQTGFMQAKKDDSVSVEEAFEQLKAEI